MLNLQTTILAGIFSVALGGFGSWWVTSDYYQARFDAAMARQKAQAAIVMQEATQEILRLQKTNQDLVSTLEVNHAQNRKKLDQALADNRRLARELGGLRDPYAISACSSPVPANAGTAPHPIDATAPGRLSDEASEFLLELAREADRAAEYAGLCHQWIRKIAQ